MRKLVKVLIEGVELSVCLECSRLGRPVEPKAVIRRRPLTTSTATHPRLSKAPFKQVKPMSRCVEEVFEAYSLIENYGLIVKRARERMGLNPKQLGAKVGEKASIIRKIEQGKFKPDIELAKKLERFLKVTLITKSEMPSEVEAFKTEAVLDRGLTIGDILRSKLKKSER